MRFSHRRHFYLPPPGKVIPGNGLFARRNLLGRARAHDFAAMHTSHRSDIDYKIRRPYRVLVMFYDYKRIADIAQIFKRRKQFFVVALVQPYARFVENIQYSRKPAAYLCRKSYPLRLPARKRGSRARKVEIIKSYVY